MKLGQGELLLAKDKVCNIMDTDYRSVNELEGIGKVKEIFMQHQVNEVFVTKDEKTYVGVLNAWSVLSNPSTLKEAEIIQTQALSSQDTVLLAMVKVKDFVGEYIPVLNEANQLVGSIPEASLLKAYQQAMEKVSKHK